ncbi:LacI family DNA-binding transcriptional regulator [Paenibacillus sp. sptzw28]|uniref:LacI family DNA-binding transcriptional regulator n=1 Tax=Paenibacillus sp. sptzw28 TaxID=715179 RepID=UPI001C6EDB9B|nr:LacI family DNA-binding transcriptional regulator [Paenibacillus sp. sptzw28]QYR20190.1 LacI family DNA-binding transcriptional regulator [Paenibacillus sp. sptzw28]
MAHKVSMQQIADRLGVSKYTVSQALSGKRGVSEATRREVMAMAAALGYRVSQREVKGQSGVLAEMPVILVGLDERQANEPMFWQRVREGIEAGCREHRLNPIFFTFEAENNRSSVFPQIDDETMQSASGIIIAGKCPAAALLRMNRTGIPVVLVDHEEPVARADAVLNANGEAGRMASHHLLSQGCRSIAFIGRDSFAVSFRERFWGCRLALDDLLGRRSPGTPLTLPEPRSMKAISKSDVHLRKWTIPYGSQTWMQTLDKRLAAAIADNDFPDGFICANDDIALHLMQLLLSRGVDVPGMCRVIGIDNTAASGGGPVPLTTVDLAKEWLGLRAVESLVRKRHAPEAPDEKVMLSASLVVRQSG